MIDPTRLYTALLNTGLQQKDNALYQVIHDLIGNLALINKQTNTIISGGGSSSIVNQTNIIQQIFDNFGMGEEGQDSIIPGPKGIQGIQGFIGIPGMDGSDGDDSNLQGVRSVLGLSGDFYINTNQLYVKTSTGFIGIGKSDPGAQLVISSNQANSSQFNWLTFRNLDTTPRGTWSFAKQNDNDLGLMYGINSDIPSVGTLVFFKYAGDVTGARLGVSQTSPVSKLDINGSVTIGTYSGVTAAPTNGMIISGLVGIGTSAPLVTLNLVSSSAVDQTIIQQWGYGLTSNTSYNLKLKQTVSAGLVQWTFDQTNNSTSYPDVFTLDRGRIGIGLVAPTAKLHIVAGAAGASLAPLKLTSGTNLTTAEAGAFEYDGTNLFFTRAGTVRENVLVAVDNVAAPGTSIGVGIVNFYGSSATNFLGDPNRWLSINILGTVYKIPLYT